MLNRSLQYESTSSCAPRAASRLLSALIDGTIMGAVTLCTMFILFVLAFGKDVPQIYWALIVLPVLIYLVPEAVSGRSLGKRMLGLEKISVNFRK